MSLSAVTSGIATDPSAVSGAGNILSALQQAMSGRMDLLDTQLTDQLNTVQSRNDQIASLNDALSKLTAFEAQIPGTDGSSTASGATADQIAQLNAALQAAGITDVTVSGASTRGQIDAAITEVKGMTDTQSNNQQMDMLRLQSLMNKRDEIFDLLSTTQKNVYDALSGIVQHM